MVSANGAGVFVVDRHGVGAQIASYPIGDDEGGLGGLWPEALFDCRNDGGEKGIVEVGNDDRNNLGLSRAQHRGARIGTIVERLHRGLDLLDELGTDALPTSQNVRNG